MRGQQAFEAKLWVAREREGGMCETPGPVFPSVVPV